MGLSSAMVMQRRGNFSARRRCSEGPRTARTRPPGPGLGACDGRNWQLVEGAPLFVVRVVDRLRESLGDVEVIDDGGGVRAVVLDGHGVGAAHVAAGPEDAFALPLAQGFGEEPMDGLTAFALPDPRRSRPVQVVVES